MNNRLAHQDILETLWGVDIAKFPAHLSTINLAINDLGVLKNYPNIAQEDFFNLSVKPEGGVELTERWRKLRLKTLGLEQKEIIHPRWFDCIVGNPPYTRQEEITEITEKKGYKESLIDKALYYGRQKLADISKRAGIYAYFFVHGTKFLKNGGRFGFIVSNSWLDVDYGKGLQELFLKNYKIVAIIESKVERWFEDADVNTCIIILERRKDQKERDENLVRFVYLFKPLRHFIPPAHDMWEKQKQRLDAIENLKKTILFHNNFYQTDEYRIYPKKQSELWEEGFDAEEGKYTGSKWGKYLRAPEIFFKIVEKSKNRLVPLKEIADVRFGIKTGANEFFYLTEEEIKEKGIEKEFWIHKDDKGEWVPNYVVKSPQECKSIIVKPDILKHRVLLINKDKKHLKGTHILRYLNEGERKGFDKRPTCESRSPSYNLGNQQPPDGLWFKAFNERVLAPLNTYRLFSSDRFYAIYLHNKIYKNRLFLYLNSTLAALIVELFGRVNLGEGALDNMTYEAASMLVVDIRKHNIEDGRAFKSLLERSISSIFDELGALSPEEVALEKVKADRRELDKIIMGDILGLTDDEQLEVYRAVVDLVRSRIEKAKSFGKKGKTKEGIDVELLTRTIKEKLGDKLLGHFYRENILNQKNLKKVKLFHPTKDIHIKNELFGWRLSSGKDHIDCQNEAEAEYLKIWLESGLEEGRVPKDESYLLKILPELKALKERIDKIISEHISSITSQKLQNKIMQKLQGELFT